MKKYIHHKSKILYTVSSLIALGLAFGGYLYYTPQKQVQLDIDNSVQLDDNKITATNLVIYENGRGFINQTYKATLHKGLQEISFGETPPALILSSASVSGNHLTLQSMNFDPIWENKTYYETAQEKAIGKEVTLLWTVWKEGVKSEIKKQAKLLAVEDNEPVLLIDNLVQKGTDARILYPALDTPIQNKSTSLDFLVNTQSDTEQEINFSYLSDGFSWKTNYNLYLSEDENKMTLKGYVQLKNNTSSDYKNANIDFVLGEVNTVSQKLPREQVPATCQIQNQSGIKLSTDPITVNGKILESMAESDDEAGIISHGRFSDNGVLFDAMGNTLEPISKILDLKDYYVYRLPFKTDLKKGQYVTALFLNKEGLPYQKEYTFQDPITLGTTKQIKNLAPDLQIVFKNDSSFGLDLPLPKGIFHIYNQKGNEMFFVGESKLYNTISLGQTGMITVGKALDVYAQIKQTNVQKLSDEQTEYTYTIQIQNASDESKTIHIKQDMMNDYTYKSATLKPDEAIPHLLSWTIEMQPRETRTFSFTLTHTDLALIKQKQLLEIEKSKLATQEKRLEAEQEYYRKKIQ